MYLWTPLSPESKTTIQLLDNKADGVLHSNCLQRWVHLFPRFAEVIKEKLNKWQYGELLFDNVRIVGFFGLQDQCDLHPRYGPSQ